MAYKQVYGEEGPCSAIDCLFNDGDKILFEGLVYKQVKTGVTIQEVEANRYDYLKVVLSGKEDKEYDVRGEGPEYVVFIGALYRKSNEDPNSVDERTAKTVDPEEPRGSDVEVEQPDVIMSEELESLVSDGGLSRVSSEEMTYAFEDVLQNVDLSAYAACQNYPQYPFSLRHLQSISSSFDLDGFYTTTPDPVLNLGTMPDYARPTSIKMPRIRPTVTKKALDGYFDLPKHRRRSRIYTPPSRNNLPAYSVNRQVPTATDSKTKRYYRSWVEEKAFFELMELGMRILGRKLQTRDFPAITEAFNRRCPPSGGAPYKGYNSLHSAAIKNNPKYTALVVRLFGEELPTNVGV